MHSSLTFHSEVALQAAAGPVPAARRRVRTLCVLVLLTLSSAALPGLPASQAEPLSVPEQENGTAQPALRGPIFYGAGRAVLPAGLKQLDRVLERKSAEGASSLALHHRTGNRAARLEGSSEEHSAPAGAARPLYCLFRVYRI